MKTKNIEGLVLIKGKTGSGLGLTLSQLSVSTKQAAFRSWDYRLKENEQRPRGKFFKSNRAIALGRFNTVMLEEPIEFYPSNAKII